VPAREPRLRARRFRRWKAKPAFLADTSGSQILEFAVALPLLVVFVVGIFDFSGAFNLKQKLSNTAREGTRFASSLPTNDLDAIGTPQSVTAIRDLVDSHLQAGRLNDCGLATQAAVNGPAMTWTYTAAGGGCAAPLVLKIERSYSFQTVVGANTFNAISTRVTLQYPYSWHFNRVIQLLVPGATYMGVTQITTDATVPNMH
jgi:Flp pilus assembly protein TadG